MSPIPPKRSNIAHLSKKLVVSMFIAGTFVAYAIHDRLSDSADLTSLTNPNDVAFAPTATIAKVTDVYTATASATVPTATTTLSPTLTKTPTPLPASITSPPTNTALSNAGILAGLSTDIPPVTATLWPTLIPTNAPTSVPPTPTKSGLYNNGQYTGNTVDAFYGTVQVKVVISNGQISDVQFLDYPHDRTRSQMINNYAMPYLKQEAIRAQNAQVNIISGATLTSEAFIQSLQSALNRASA